MGYYLFSYGNDEIPGVLVGKRSPVTWGNSLHDALHHLMVMKEVAYMTWHFMAIPDKYLVPMQKDLLEHHFKTEH